MGVRGAEQGSGEHPEGDEVLEFHCTPPSLSSGHGGRSVRSPHAFCSRTGEKGRSGRGSNTGSLGGSVGSGVILGNRQLPVRYGFSLKVPLTVTWFRSAQRWSSATSSAGEAARATRSGLTSLETRGSKFSSISSGMS